MWFCQLPFIVRYDISLYVYRCQLKYAWLRRYNLINSQRRYVMKSILVVVVVFGVAGLCFANNAPEGDVLFYAKNGTVTFNHAGHAATSGDCKKCHHNGVESGPCRSCHASEGKTFKTVAHLLCKDCHKTQGVKKSCDTCHKK